MNLLLIGPMYGKDWREPAFVAAAHAIRKKGHTVLNPFEYMDLGPGPDDRESRNDLSELDIPKEKRQEILLVYAGLFRKHPDVALMVNWNASALASAMVGIANFLRLTKYDAATLKQYSYWAGCPFPEVGATPWLGHFSGPESRWDGLDPQDSHG